MKIKSIFFALILSSTIFANNQISEVNLNLLTNNEELIEVNEWTEALIFNGILVEYKFEECNSDNVKNQKLVLFRFTNTTSTAISFKWALQVYRDGECQNCDRIDSTENNYEITLIPGEVVQGDCSSKENKSLYLFANFVNLSPGMSEQHLTNFKFTHLSSRVSK